MLLPRYGEEYVRGNILNISPASRIFYYSFIRKYENCCWIIRKETWLKKKFFLWVRGHEAVTFRESQNGHEEASQKKDRQRLSPRTHYLYKIVCQPYVGVTRKIRGNTFFENNNYIYKKQ